MSEPRSGSDGNDRLPGVAKRAPTFDSTMKFLVTSLLSFAVVMTATAAEFEIDADFPGGNIIVSGIDGDTVRLNVDLRDTTQKWFYWSFRIRGAEGRTLNFEFPAVVRGFVGNRGPAISDDDGMTWRWLGDKPDFARTKFRYDFGPDEKEVLFGVGMNYTEKNLKSFFEKYENNKDLKIETLCLSKKERNVELLRIPDKGKDADFKICLFARHHACEMMASYVLEGMIETVLSDSDDGTWLREHGDFFIVPFVDKDGVEQGDQGKARRPHDHNRDYVQRIYPEVRAIMEQVPARLDGKPVLWIDMHCPMLRNVKGGPTPLETMSNESLQMYGTFHQPGTASEECWERQRRFSKILEAERKGPIPYVHAFLWDINHGQERVSARMEDPALLGSSLWAAMTLPNVVFATTLEIPYSNASGKVVDVDSARAFGHDMAHAIRVFLEKEAKQH